MQLIEAMVRSPVKVAVGVLLVALFGAVALLGMPMQLTPEVQTPTISVETSWPGASPQEIEREIVIEQEEQLKSVEGITKLTSESTDSKATVTLEFQVGTDMNAAVVDVVGRLEQVREYPEDADKPTISTASAADRPIAWFILSSRNPSDEQIVAVQQAHPELTEQLELIRRTESAGLAMLRLRRLAVEHPAIETLLPPEDRDISKLKRFAEDEIEARFERVPGVSQANVFGGRDVQLEVVVDPQLLAARQLTINDVRRVLEGQNADVSAGDFWEAKRRWVVRTLGQFRSPQEVEQQLLAVREGRPVYVRDVAQVQLGYKKPDALVRRFGETSISVNVIRETGANVLDIMEGLRAVNQELNQDILADQGLVLTQVYDETDYILSAVDLVQQNIFIGGALTMIVLMLFLHLNARTLLAVPLIVATALAAAFVSPWFFVICLALILGCGFWFARGALVVGLAIPTSIIGTFLILGLLGRSLNVISLAGLAFAVGMLVDNAVVVLENIYRRHAELGEPPLTAAVRGTHEVWGAVVASTLTTVAVFLPIVFVQEEAGQLFRDIALAISAAVSLSLIVSVTVISTASARLFREQPKPSSPERESSPQPKDLASRTAGPKVAVRDPAGIGDSLLLLMQRLGTRLTSHVVAANHWIQRRTARQLGVVVLLVATSIGLSYLFWPKVEYLPTGNRNLVIGIMQPPPGYNLDQLVAMGKTVEEQLQPYWDVDPESDQIRQLDHPAVRDFFLVARGRQVFMGIRTYDPTRAGDVVPLIQQVGRSFPGTFVIAKQSSLFEQGLTAGRTIEVEITGPDLRRLVGEDGLGGRVLGAAKQLMPEAQIRPVPSLDLSTPEVHIEPKLVQDSEMGISTAELGYTADALIDGAYAGDYYLDNDKIDLVIQGRQVQAENLQQIRSLPVSTPTGQLVPLEALAKIEMSSGPEQVNHRERVRAVTIEISPPAEVPLEDAMRQISEEVVEPLRLSGDLRGGYRISLSGTADKLRSTWQALRFNVLLALLITYLLMAALFESWLYPLVVILSVPLGAVGGVLGLNLLNLFYLQPLDVLTMLGFVILIGTVVNNPILIVHQSLNYMREGWTQREAVLESVRTRIRPILMTTSTTVLGLLPLVLFPGAGSELYRGLGSVVLGGLIVSTAFTLILVPTLFSLLMNTKERILRQLRLSAPRSEDDTSTARPTEASPSDEEQAAATVP